MDLLMLSSVALTALWFTISISYQSSNCQVNKYVLSIYYLSNLHEYFWKYSGEIHEVCLSTFASSFQITVDEI